MALGNISLGDSFRIMRMKRMYIYFGIVIGALYGLFDIFNTYLSSFLPDVESIPENVGAYRSILLAKLVLFILYFIAISFFSAALTRYVANHIHSRDEDVFSVAAHKMPGILFLDFILIILITGALVILVVPTRMFPGLICLTFSLAVLILLVFSLRLPFAIYALVVDDMDPIDSLKHSWEITRGRMLDVFVLLVMAALPSIPFIVMLSSLKTFLPAGHIYVSVIADIFLGPAVTLGIIHITRGYLELSREPRKKERDAGSGVVEPHGVGVTKQAFAFGLSEYEINRLRREGVFPIPVSYRAEQTRVGELIAYPDFYQGDSGWYPGKAILFYGMGTPELSENAAIVRSTLGDDVILGTVNIRNVDMSVGQLLEALKREHEASKGSNPPPE